MSCKRGLKRQKTFSCSAAACGDLRAWSPAVRRRLRPPPPRRRLLPATTPRSSATVATTPPPCRADAAAVPGWFADAVRRGPGVGARSRSARIAAVDDSDDFSESAATDSSSSSSSSSSSRASDSVVVAIASRRVGLSLRPEPSLVFHPPPYLRLVFPFCPRPLSIQLSASTVRSRTSSSP